MRIFYISLVIIAGLFINKAMAQQQITVQHAQLTTQSGTVPAYKVTIYQTLQPKVIKEWSREVVNETGRKGRKKPVMTNAEYSIDSVFIKQIAEEPVNIASSFMQKENGVEMIAAINYKGQYIDSSKQTLNERASNYIRNFAVEQYRDAVKEELESEKNKLELLNQQLDQLVKENTKYKKNIASYNNDTLDLKQDIQMQSKLKEARNQEILQQEMNVARAKSDPVKYKEQKKKLAEMKQDTKQISNKIKRDEREIVSIVSDIESARRQISLNEQDQEKQKGAIESQMQLVEKINLKLGNIR